MYVSARELRLVGCARLALVATVLFVIIALFAMILIFVMIAVIGAFSGFVVAVVSGVMMGALMVIVRTKRPTHTFKLRRPRQGSLISLRLDSLYVPVALTTYFGQVSVANPSFSAPSTLLVLLRSWE